MRGESTRLQDCETKATRDSLQRVLVGGLDAVKDEADDDALPRLALAPSLDTAALGLLAELAPLAAAHVADVEHQAVQRAREQDLVLVVGRLRAWPPRTRGSETFAERD